MPPKITVKSLPKSARPREKISTQGAQSLATHELLAAILGNGNKDQGVLELSKTILKKFGTKNLASADFKNLRQIKGLGLAKACLILASLELGKRIFEKENQNVLVIKNEEDALNAVGDLRIKKKEYLIALFLNSRNELIAKEEISMGGGNTVFASPADLLRPALLQNASQFIMVHNHPSGNATPSPEDLQLTKRVFEAGQMVGVKLLDHLILSLRESVSLKKVEPNLFNPE